MNYRSSKFAAVAHTAILAMTWQMLCLPTCESTESNHHGDGHEHALDHHDSAGADHQLVKESVGKFDQEIKSSVQAHPELCGADMAFARHSGQRFDLNVTQLSLAEAVSVPHLSVLTAPYVHKRGPPNSSAKFQTIPTLAKVLILA